jgi:sodium/bile acid cotransporter 7
MDTANPVEPRTALSAIKLDHFTIALVATVALASLLPARGGFVAVTDTVGYASIVLLFFLHGANLSHRAVIASLAQWRLHLAIFSSTFLLFPLVGLMLAPLSGKLIDPSLYLGILFLCCLPSTVQSSIAFTSIARGNVPAAICSASASNLLGIVLTPLLTGLLLSRHGGVTLDAWTSIVGSILLPFVVGQLLQRWIGASLDRHRHLLGLVDRGSVLIMVYAAFGKAVTQGIWHTISLDQLAILIILCIAILVLVMLVMRSVSRWLGFSRADEAAVVFCGSKKSLITGVPMASILFSGPMVGAIVLPLMTFHQIQLIVCAFFARAYQRKAESEAVLSVNATAS